MRRKLTALFTALFLALTTVGAAAELRVIQTGEEVPLGENPYLFDTPLTGQVAIEMRFQVPAGFTEHRLTLADSAGNTLNAIGQQPERSGALLFFDSTYLRLGFVTGGNPLAFFAHRNAKHTVTAVIDFSAPSARKPVRFFVDGQWIDRHVTNAGVLLPVELWSALNDLKRVEVTSSALSDGWLESVKVYPAVVADWQPMAPASSTPADGARGVSEDARITLTFHNEINAAVLNESGFSVTANGVPSEVRRVFAEDGGKTAVLELGERLAFNTEYTVTYSGITDIHGFADEAASGGFSFTTRDGYVKAEGLGVYDSGGAEVTDPVAGTVEGRATVTNYSETGDKSVSLALALYEEQNGVARLSDIASSPLQTLARGESAILRIPLHITEPSGKTLRLYLERDADARTTVTDGGFFTLSREGQSFRITGTANANEPIEIEVFKGTELPAALSRANTAYFARTEADGAGAFAFAFGFADGDSTGEYLFRVKTENTIYQRRFSYVTDEDARNTANLLANGTAADVLDLLKNNAAARFALAAEGFFLAEFSALGNGAQTYIAERFTAAPPYGFAECAALLNTLTAYEDIAAAASAEKFAKYREIFNLPLYGDYASAANVQGNIDAYVNRRSPFRQEGGETARERLANAFTEGVAVELLNAAVSGTIAEVISKYNDILRLNTAGAFSALSPADQTKAVNALIGGAFTSPADAREQFDDTVRRLGVKGSGGGGAGGGSVPVRVSQDAMVDDSIPMPPPTARFTDLQGYEWASGAIAALYANGVVSGFSDEEFRPGGAVTREQFVKMLTLCMGLQPLPYDADFTDVDPDSWYAPYAAAAIQAGLVNGVSASAFGVGAYITRQDAAVLLARTLESGGGGAVPFTDAEDIDDYARAAVSAVFAAGIVNGYEDGSFLPRASVTRAEAAKIIYALSAQSKEGEV